MELILFIGLIFIIVVIWFATKGNGNGLKLSWNTNRLIRDDIVMKVFSKYAREEGLSDNEFELILLARSLNWAIPSMVYTLESDLAKVDNISFREQLLSNDGDQIFKKGLSIIKSNPELEKLVAYNISYQLYLVDKILSDDEASKKFPGLNRMKKYLFHSSEPELDVSSITFCDEYKKLFVQFHNKFGTALKKEDINLMFTNIKNK